MVDIQHQISDNYNSDLVTLGMTYKMDTFVDNFVVGPFLSGLENNKFYQTDGVELLHLCLKMKMTQDRSILFTNR